MGQAELGNSQVQGAKVGVEQARAENLQGEADLKSQNFVQNQTGESHLRELDKQTLANQGAIEREQVKGELASDAQKSSHNSELLKMLASSQLSNNQSTRQAS